jgi:hypothetical protein
VNVTLSPETYRWLDRLSKLAGIALSAAGLQTGGDTLAGVALAATGVAIGLSTVFIDHQ